jgi:hypothetical protein
LNLFQRIDEKFSGDAVTAVSPWNMLQRGWFGDLFPPEFAGSIYAANRAGPRVSGRHLRMMYIQAINKVDTESTASKITSKVKETKGLGPEVVSGKVVDPGVDKDKIRGHAKKQCMKLRSFQGCVNV